MRFACFAALARDAHANVSGDGAGARDHAKEVKLFGLGPRLLQRYRDIFTRLYREDRALSIRRDSWGFGLSLLATSTLYGAYAWIALSTIRASITLGQMTMYLLLFRQGQGAVTAILSASAHVRGQFVFVDAVRVSRDTCRPFGRQCAARADPSDGVRFEHVNFSYPGAAEPALIDINLQLRPGSSLALVARTVRARQL